MSKAGIGWSDRRQFVACRRQEFVACRLQQEGERRRLHAPAPPHHQQRGGGWFTRPWQRDDIAACRGRPESKTRDQPVTGA